jgi:hypothetical protein
MFNPTAPRRDLAQQGPEHRLIMKKLSVLGIISGAALLAAAPFSLQWSQKTVTLSLDSADARIGRPLTPLSVAGVHRRAYRRAYRGAAYAVGAGAVGYGIGAYYGGYGYPAYSAPSAPYYGTGYGSYYGGYSYPTYSYPSYGYPAYGHGGYYRPGYRVARRVAIHRARWR